MKSLKKCKQAKTQPNIRIPKNVLETSTVNLPILGTPINEIVFFNLLFCFLDDAALLSKNNKKGCEILRLFLFISDICFISSPFMLRNSSSSCPIIYYGAFA